MSTIYETKTVTVPASGRLRIGAVGLYFRVLTAARPFLVAFDTSEIHSVEQGLQIRTAGFSELTFVNKDPTDLTIEFAVSAAGVDDSRVSVPGSGIAVFDPAGSESFSDLIAALREDRLQRAPLTTLEGASHNTVTNGTLTIATAVANTAGVIVRMFFGAGTGNTALMRADGNAVLTIDPAVHSGTERDLFIPAGVEVTLVSTGTGAAAHAWTEVL